MVHLCHDHADGQVFGAGRVAHAADGGRIRIVEADAAGHVPLAYTDAGSGVEADPAEIGLVSFRPGMSSSFALAIIRRAYVRDIKIPKAIEESRIGAARQAQVLDSTLKRYQIDSVGARATVLRAQAEAEATRLRAQAYSSNPALVELERSKALADGIARACSGSQITTCVIGGSVLDVNRKQ